MSGTIGLLGLQESRRLMGVNTTVTIEAADPRPLVASAFERLHRYEALWSRFIPTSDISRLNLAAGSRTIVDPETRRLIEFMIAANRVTHGAFNPTMLPLQLRDGDSHSLVDDGFTRVGDNAVTWENLDAIDIVDESTIMIPATMTLDVGGVAKGYAADLVADAAIASGAASVSVNIGGDARVASIAGWESDWTFEVIDEGNHEAVSTVSIRQGAIATSAPGARHRSGRGPRNHLHSTHGHAPEVSTVSVITGLARWAEVLTKQIIFDGNPAAMVANGELATMIVMKDRKIAKSRTWKEFEQ